MCGEEWQIGGYVATYGGDRWQHHSGVGWQAMAVMGGIKGGARWQNGVF